MAFLNDDGRSALAKAHELAVRFQGSLAERRVAPTASFDEILERIGGPLPDEGVLAASVVEQLVADVEDGIVASPGPRYFGFVIGGALPAAVSADWLATSWDQNAGLVVCSPAAAAVEQVTATWLVELLGLPASASVGFVTGGQMANFTALAAARHAVLERVGWDVEERGLFDAPHVDVVTSAESHATVFTALGLLGLGRDRVKKVATDEQGRILAAALASVLQHCKGPTIVCAQAGNVNTGSFDPIGEIARIARAHGAWLHVDGAFGLWAAASPKLQHLVAGLENADSWATDAHKWLNVPYDSGLAIVAHPVAHRAPFVVSGSYLTDSTTHRDPHHWTPEASRRARGFAIYAALRSLGRRGVARIVERCCELAARMAERLRACERLEVLNDVVSNQVLVGVRPRSGQDDTEAVRTLSQRVQSEGTCWLSETTWKNRPAMRISVSNWSTTESDIDRSADVITG